MSNIFVVFLYTFFLYPPERLIQVDLYEKIKSLAANRKISIRQLEESLGFGNGVINRWRTTTPGVDKIEKVADYFDVSTDYLLGRTENKHMIIDPKKRALSVEEALDSVMSYDGEPLTDNDREVLRRIVEGYLSGK